ncbi:glutathione S-transferase [Tistlia consotensis]|uniref:Glutathione S-transferase n=1 Tax=Tistlia consotensis USBA 355 TaxID=560819 RepID=A0A1Y6BN91_9PROT|nr:glutathione S-transferase [Tistlia consotensis]SMF09480.1 glutathione S-transferase [Tistlia consotensis USBA 355]SNR34503.1 glutathione S-transferase [Tistlia consotensis]
MLTIWGRSNSINVQKVMWAVGELGLEHERIDVGGAFGGLDGEAYGRLNPNRRVPTLQDGDLTLWESNAIVRYLAEAYGAAPFFPETLHGRALAGQWMDWMTTTILPPMTTAFWGLIRTPPERRDTAAIEQALAGCAAAFALLDAQLAGRAFLLGEALTMGDLPVGCATYRWYAMPIERPALANLEAYHGRLRARPAFAEHVMIPLS